MWLLSPDVYVLLSFCLFGFAVRAVCPVLYCMEKIFYQIKFGEKPEKSEKSLEKSEKSPEKSEKSPEKGPEKGAADFFFYTILYVNIQGHELNVDEQEFTDSHYS